MKKLILLFMLAMSPLLWLAAQGNLNQVTTTSYEILWQLDSLIPCHHYHPIAGAEYHRDSLNKYHFAADSLPPMSSDLIVQRLQEIGSPLDLHYNDDVQAFINLYTLQRREQVERMLGLAHVYFPIFDEVLDREGLPMELRYLPIVESALNPHARSHCGATGLWQFMLSTGNLYSLDVTSYVDERRDPYKSTEAAIRYLKNMYKTYGDWLLVVAAYNCGPGNVNKAIARSGGKRTFWEISEFLPRETRSYVPALIAATYVFNYNAEHNLFPRMVDFTYNQDTIHVSRQQLSLKHLADLTHTDFWTLKDLNPELKLDIVPYQVEPYVLRVPMKMGQFFAVYRDSILTLAKTLNVDSARAVYSDAKVSPLTNKPYVSEVSESASYASASAVSSSGKDVIYHKVRRGEVVGSIASKYHVSAKDISKWNSLRNYNIQVGQSLKIYVKNSISNTPPKVVPVATEPKPVIASTVKPADEGQMASLEGTPSVLEKQGALPKTTPAVVEPKPVVTPTKVEPQPAVAKVEPKPVVTPAKVEPQPIVAKVEPKPVVTPAKVEPQPVVAKVEPQPVVAKVEPKPVVTPAKVEPQPVVAKVEPKPAVTPVKVEPKAVVTPAKVEPQPVVAKVEPKPVVTPAKVEPKPETKLSDLGAKYHVVKQGDTLWQIANAYDGLTVEKIKSLNALPDNKLEVGQKLRVQ